jgi:predicted DNA-binding protein YlxM (UPF0122 family)
MQTYNIYGLADPRTGHVRYVGITINLITARLSAHRKASKRTRTPCACWMRKLSTLSLQPQVFLLETTCDASRETYWIRFFRAAGATLLNCDDGGRYHPNITEETRQRQSEAARERERRYREQGIIHRRWLGMKHSEETKQKLREINRGRKLWSEEQKLALSRRMAESWATGAINVENIVRGSQQPTSRLTEEQVALLRQRYSNERISQAQLAKEFGVSQGAVCQALRGKTWTHVSSDPVTKPWEDTLLRGSANNKTKLTEDQVRDIRRRHSEGVSVANMATEFKMDRSTLHDLISRRTWKHVE